MKRFTFFTMPFLFCGIFLLSQKSISQNLLFDGDFSTTTSITPAVTDPPPLNIWSSWVNDATGTSFSTNVQNGVCSYVIANAGINMYDVQLAQWGFQLTLNHRYRLSFDVKADAERDFGVFIGENGGSWTNLNPTYLRHANADWQTITIDIDATAVFALHKLSFEMGIQNIGMYFAHVSLVDLGPIVDDKVVIASSFEHYFGCSDWDPNCDQTALTYNSSTNLWTGTFDIPAGCYQYKVPINGSWDVNYGEHGIKYGANIDLYLAEQTSITFTYDPSTHLVQTSPITSGFSTNCIPQVVLAGSFQTALGCSADWDATCLNTALLFNAATGMFENDLSIPPGYYEYRAILNNDWNGNNFGNGGIPNGGNYSIYLCETTRVHFTYDPITHIVTENSQPNTVVIAGSFQSELGCTGDWLADCNNTRLTYDPNYGAWVDTFDLPAGHWEYKVTINNSWDQNYGLNGEAGGPNIPLDLCYPAKVIFTYYHSSCYHYVYTQIITNGVCINKFYDANVNGYQDPGEESMGGIMFTLAGNGISQTQTTDNNGKAAFTNLPDGFYVIKEKVPPGYYAVTDSQFAYIFNNNITAYFGNVCLGAGGAKGLGYWSSKNGEDALNKAGKMDEALLALQGFSLRNADGSDFDPYTYSQLKSWLNGVSAKNMTYMLSAQIAVMFLNTELGYVDRYNSYLYTPGCGLFGNGNFMNVDGLIWNASYFLSVRPIVTGKDPDRAYFECLKNSFDNANNNLTFVQPHPCGLKTRAEENKALVTNEISSPEVKIWPNPSNNYFILRPTDKGNKETVELKVYNVNGQQVYKATGFSNKDYQFGEGFISGIYMVEFTQGNNKKTFKLVKQ